MSNFENLANALQPESIVKVTISRDGKQLAHFEGKDAENAAFVWLLRNQSNSVDWALRYEGYKVEVNTNGDVSHWKPYASK